MASRLVGATLRGGKLLPRHGTAASWADIDPVLEMSEIGVEEDGGRLKIGDGETAWNDLPYDDASGLSAAIMAEVVARQAADDLLVPLTQRGANSGVATLDGSGKLPASQLPTDVMQFKGVWNASTNTPTLTDGSGSPGDYYKVGVGAARDLGSGSQTFVAGDAVILNASSVWERLKASTIASAVSISAISGLVATDAQAALAELRAQLLAVESGSGKPVGGTGLPGAIAATRYVGGTASGPPATGTFVVGDFVITQTAKVYVCTVAGSPGTWVQAGGGGTAASVTFTPAGGIAATDVQAAIVEAVTDSQAYADGLLAANDALVYKGAIDASASPNYPAAGAGHAYKISVAGKIGGASGTVVQVGDLAICTVDGTAAGTQAAVGSNWTIIQSNLDVATAAVLGTVRLATAPAVATDPIAVGDNDSRMTNLRIPAGGPGFLHRTVADGGATWDALGSAVFEEGRSFVVSGPVAVPVAGADDIPPIIVPVRANTTVTMTRVMHRIGAGTSATIKLQRNGVDITGYTGMVCTSALGTVNAADVTLVEGDTLSVIVTAVSGAPQDMTVTLVLETTTQGSETSGGQYVSVRSYGAVGDGATVDYVAISNAINSVAPTGGVVYFPPGIYLTNTKIVVPGGVLLLGSCLDYAVTGDTVTRGSVIRCGASLLTGDPVVQLGTDGGAASTSGLTGASMERMIVDADEKAQYGIKTFGRRNYIRWCQAWSANISAVAMAGQNGYLLDSVIGNKNVGTPVAIGNADNKVARCQVRQGGIAQISVDGAAFSIQDCHIFGGADGSVVGTTGHNILITGGAVGGEGRGLITGNVIEGTNGHGIVIRPGATFAWTEMTITGNKFYNVSGFPDATYSCVALDVTAAGSVIRTLTMSGNVASMAPGVSSVGVPVRYKALVEKIGAGTLEMIEVVCNSGNQVQNVAVGFRPTHSYANSIRGLGGLAGIAYSDNHGRATFSGNGSTTAFVIAHGCDTTPNDVSVTPGSAASAAPFFATADGTNITVTFTAAPAAGTNNVVLNWSAET